MSVCVIRHTSHVADMSLNLAVRSHLVKSWE